MSEAYPSTARSQINLGFYVNSAGIVSLQVLELDLTVFLA